MIAFVAGKRAVLSHFPIEKTEYQRETGKQKKTKGIFYSKGEQGISWVIPKVHTRPSMWRRNCTKATGSIRSFVFFEKPKES